MTDESRARFKALMEKARVGKERYCPVILEKN